MSENCPCCSGLEYRLCCYPYLSRHAPPSSAEALMRSRYCAWAKGDVDYLVSSWHVSQCTDELILSLKESVAQTHWLGLTITASEDGSNENEAFVTFFARYLQHGKNAAIYERSRFIRQTGSWYYTDGTYLTPERNMPCPCGSGRKYKKCCNM